VSISDQILSTLFVCLALSTQASAKDTGYVFVSNEKTNDVAVIDPRQEDRVIKWIPTSHRPRGMAFRDDRRQLLVACGYDRRGNAGGHRSHSNRRQS